ncbi:helix-turn-helix transcriptional regulator [Acetobacter persici]|uniref:helix-turn-helix transcriptional regulator n=1 Tax=Acetobacter persici TaxID=1076596 RepID=UPI0020CB9F97|nr:helix-turn-helix transcriptional regulator [Acetobacter persici]MCP9319659.1 helix-turn-helix transcriptional regulator [Acetobacter persici]
MKNQIRELRLKHNLSQQDLGERIGVSRQTINSIEAERYDPSLPLAFKISKFFGLQIEEIFYN